MSFTFGSDVGFYFILIIYYLLPLNVLHQLEVSASGLNFFDCSRNDFVHELTKHHAIL